MLGNFDKGFKELHILQFVKLFKLNNEITNLPIAVAL